MSTFSDLFDSMDETSISHGSRVLAVVVAITDDKVIVDSGLKTTSAIPKDEFIGPDGMLSVEIGDSVEVLVEELEDGSGETVLSREKARRSESWSLLESIKENDQRVVGNIIKKVRGGFIVSLKGYNVEAFLPASLIDVKSPKNSFGFDSRDLEFKLIKIEKPNNVVVSRKAIVSEESTAERDMVLSNLEEGQIIVGVVKNLTNYGAFVDIGGGVDGLLHITDMSWKRVRHPSEVIAIGQELKVKVLKFDRDKRRVSLGLKQTGDDPWHGVNRRYPVGSRLCGRVTNVADYGCFVEIEDGIEGLVHMSEMDWTNKNVHPSKIVSVGGEVEVIVLEVDEDRRRISLGIKQCQTNPWESFAHTHKKGDKVSGKIKSVTDFGLFIGLDGGIDGLIHLSDISWEESGEKALRKYKKGQDVEATILAIDAERERISLGIKQLGEDSISEYFVSHPKGSVVDGEVIEVNPKFVIVKLCEDVDGRIKSSDVFGKTDVDATDVFSVGDRVDAMVCGIDRKARFINLATRKLLTESEEDEVQYKNTQFGDLLKEQIDKNDE